MKKIVIFALFVFTEFNAFANDDATDLERKAIHPTIRPKEIWLIPIKLHHEVYRKIS